MRNCIKTEIKDDVEVVKEEVEIMSDTDSSDGVGVMSDSVSDREMSEEDKTVGDDMLGTKLKIIIVKVNLDRILKAVLVRFAFFFIYSIIFIPEMHPDYVCKHPVSHLYWLACNKCNTRFLPPQTNKKMFLSSCGCMRSLQVSTKSGCLTFRAALD